LGWQGWYDRDTVIGMTKKITISVPDDVADELVHVENVSAYVTASLRRDRRIAQVREHFARDGIVITPEGVAHARERIRVARLAAAMMRPVDQDPAPPRPVAIAPTATDAAA
jgi:hypothetical protein